MRRRASNPTFEPERFSRTWWLRRIRNAAWVVLVTVLVWVYADAEFTDEADLTATVEFSPARPDRFVLLSKDRLRTTFTARGRRSSLESLQRWLAQPETTIRHMVAEGQTAVDVRDVLNASPGFVKEGVTVLSARPAMVRARLDEKVRRPDIPVELTYTGAFAPEIAIDPPALAVEVSRARWEQLLKAGVKPVLKTAPVDLKTVRDDVPFEVQVVPRIADVPVELERDRVTVRVKVTKITEPKELSIPVLVVSPSTWAEDGTWRQFTLRRQDPTEWRPKIRVSGPRKDLDKLRPEDVVAYVVLTEDDKKPVSWLTRRVEVHLPEDLDVALTGPAPTVTFKLEKLPPAGP